ncbi:MAG: sensor histidine kinase KdpD [Anaerolineales bacterium]|nr:sensor histidine kinase KdpD [Anaerolineales bacterium]
MPPSTRPNPDQLLEHVQREETRQKRGKFKIFLGYAAGVGKTFAMLEAAQQLRAEGADVVAAYVETHKRAETEEMLKGLEIIPRQSIEYRGVSIPEMDLDAVLARQPHIALVDELAHTNAPGCRHDKRYQDIQELLEAGIGVHTTLNIQHLESLNDVVAQITGIIVRETVPDWVLDEADEIELIDLPPAELRQRLDEGKVYVPDQAARATRKFFRPGNLTALREMALRRTADRVDAQMRAYMQTHAIAGPWPAGERLLVCIGPNPLSERLVRTARRLANRLNAEWFAVYVELPDQTQLSDADHDRITRALRLADELGAKSLTLPGNSVTEAILTYAHANNITKIVAGKPIHTGWAAMMRRSIVDQIIHHSGHIDVYVISAEPGDEGKVEFTLPSPMLQHRWKRWLQSTLLILAVTLIGLPLRGVIEPTNLVMLYLIAVVMAAVWWGRSPAILASLLGVIAFDLIFIPPYYLFAVSDAEYILTFIAFLGTGFVTGNLASRVREQARTAQRREAQTAAQYELSRALATAADLINIGEAVVTHAEKLVGARVVLFIHEHEDIRPLAMSNGLTLTDHEKAVATWAYEKGQPAGHGTDTLTGAEGLYLPLQSQEGIGVLGVFPENRLPILPEQSRLLESFASQTALAIERVQFAEKARHAQLLQETEKLQTALLNSISHDLRTPLASITGALSALREEAPLLDEPARQDLLATAAEEADRLNRLVGNLLDMTRLESGALRIALKPGDLQDAIGVALSQLGPRLRHREVKLSLPSDMPLVPMDFVLVVQVIVNLLDNADKYSPPDKPILVRAMVYAREVLVEIADRGNGIPEAEQERIFDKFYRVRQSAGGAGAGGVGGTGLGLSISKGIVEAHGGRIWAQNRAGGGALFTFALPLSTPKMENVP